MAQPKAEEKKAEEEQSPFEPTNESQIVLTEDDQALIEKMTAKYGDRLSSIQSIYPHAILRFVIGYAHEAEREKVTLEHFDDLLECCEAFKWPTILNEPLENEETMFKAWPIYMYGFDHQGHPVVYDESPSCDIPLIKATFQREDGTANIDVLKRFRYRFHIRLANAKRIQAEKLGTTVFMHSMVMDLKGFSKAHFGQTFREIQKMLISTEQLSVVV